MKAAGFGGFELQTVYPLTISGDVRFLSPQNLHAIRLAGKTAQAEGLRFDLTLGSGWPFGGSHIPADLASAGLQMVTVPARAGSVLAPKHSPGAYVVAAFAGRTLSTVHQLHFSHSQAIVPSADKYGMVYFILSVPTGQQVKRAAFGAEGPVLDHMSAAAVQRHLSFVGGNC